MSISRFDLTHATTVESDHRTVEVALEQLRGHVSEGAFTGDTMLLNMGPQHPSTHGVLRLMLELDGENIVTCIPDVGFLHTGIEKNMEAKTFEKALVMTDRIDYLNNLGNNLVYSLAVEKLCEIDVPERAQIIRVIIAELQRLNSHLIWLGTHILDLGATSVFLYCLREREYILDIFEMVSGQRMMGSYIRPGGVWRDVTADFKPAVREFTDYLVPKIDDYVSLLDANPLFKERTQNIGVISAKDAIAYGLSGPILRGSGVNFDIRRAMPYSGYEKYEFNIPTGTNGDIFDRYQVRIEEMRQSIHIIRQALKELTPSGTFRSNNRKFVPPPRAELGQSMEAVIHHFKLWTEGFMAPKGEAYARIESPRGELGVLIAGDGGPKPARVHFRAPSFVNMQALQAFTKGALVADLVGFIGSVDIVLGDCDR